jgi:hypothetical protein
MKLLVCGGRDYQDRDTIYWWLNLLNPSEIVHGACKVSGRSEGFDGADGFADEWALAHGITLNRHPADWTKHGKSAGPKRNREMLDRHPDVDMVIGFGGDKGTRNMLGLAQRCSLPTVWIAPTLTSSSSLKGDTDG